VKIFKVVVLCCYLCLSFSVEFTLLFQWFISNKEKVEMSDIFSS
jgi:hypothetical protein